MPAFPHHLCTILHAGSERPDPVVLRSEVERGLARQRRSAADARVQVSLQLGFETLAAADEFETWFYGEALGGAAWFSFNHPRGDRVVTARVVGGSLGAITPLAEAYRVAERTVDIEYIRPSFVVLPPGLHPVSPSRVLATQRNSTATFVDSAGVLQTAAANVARFSYFGGKNIYSGARDIVVGPGFYGAAHAIKTAANNPANLRPGETLTVSAQVYQDAASLADGVGRVAQLFLWAQNAAGVWQVQSSVIGADIQPSGRLSASITLPALPSDMDSVTVGLYHIGGNGAWLGTVRADAVMVERGAVATAYEPGARLLVEVAGTNLIAEPEAFDAGAWVKQNTTVAPGLFDPAPNGVQFVADAVVETAANISHNLYSNAVAPGRSFSVFAKSAGVRYLAVWAFVGGVLTGRTFDLVAGTQGAVWAGSGTLVSSFIHPLGNGYFRVGITASADFSTCVLDLRQTDGWGSEAYAGNPANSVYLWGAQMETGAITSYTPNTRAADLIQVAA
jgi:hypothetical protein